MRDLAPTIFRQRAVVEGTLDAPIGSAEIEAYLDALATTLDMRALTQAVTHRFDRFGWAGWVHWETSGAHFYAWDEPAPFFSVDVYTCKPFDVADLVGFTERFLRPTELAYRSV